MKKFSSFMNSSVAANAGICLLLAAAGSAVAQPYPPSYQSPPIIVTAVPVYYPPPPNPLDVIGAIVTLPFQVIGGIASVIAGPPQQYYVMPDGSLVPVPVYYAPALLYSLPPLPDPPPVPHRAHRSVHSHAEPQFDQNGKWLDPNPTPPAGAASDIPKWTEGR
jgi:hypothetical protein